MAFTQKGPLTMLHIYPIVLEVYSPVAASSVGYRAQRQRPRPAVAARERKRSIESRRRYYSRGKNRAARYHTALGSARETLACLEVAQSFGYVGPLDATLQARLRQVIGTLVRLVENSP